MTIKTTDHTAIKDVSIKYSWVFYAARIHREGGGKGVGPDQDAVRLRQFLESVYEESVRCVTNEMDDFFNNMCFGCALCSQAIVMA